MSIGEDGGYGDDRGPGTGQTRIRLPDGEGDPYSAARRSRTGLSSRNLVTIVGVVVLLIAAIAFANRGGSGDSETAGGSGDSANKGPAAARPTAPTGTKPVTGKNGGIASGFARTQQGAESAAANYAVVLGSERMFKTDSRHQIVDAVYAPEAAAKLKGPQDKAYSTAFLSKLGLDAAGNAPKGQMFISRTIPVGTKVQKLSGDTAMVDVWYTGLIGMAGGGSTDPVRTTWKTWTFDLTWTGGDWKVVSDSQKDGPAPIAGDVPASTADEMSKAVEQFGGFTYAR
ncbi:hypothetical protein [Streptomyces sp. CT34]|uniref:hypothetical protein n=1 Tax=Streptomyces sp. CT34 TaxID=1553907 RepID=UPI0005BE13D2|nr:hypothetical protein [Streptomyces sp. CT34]